MFKEMVQKTVRKNGHIKKITDRLEELKKVGSDTKQFTMALIKAEEDLLLSKAKYKKLSALFKTVIDLVPHIIWAKDLERRYTFANKAMCQGILKIDDYHDAIGKTDEELGNKLLCQKTTSLSEKQSFVKQGIILDKEYSVYVQRCPILDDAQKLIGTVSIGVDITDTKLIHEELMGLLAIEDWPVLKTILGDYLIQYDTKVNIH
jgi:PAS domain-containing protein